MIDVQAVKGILASLTQASESDAQIVRLSTLCSAKLESMLRNEESGSDIRVITAAAYDAFYQWTLIALANDEASLKSMKAGDITVSCESKEILEAAREMKNSAFEAVTELLKDTSFYFGEVDIDESGLSV